MTAQRPDLPPTLSAIAEVAGLEVALAIARSHGGTRVTMPVRADGRNWLVALAGLDAAAAIIAALGGGRRLDIPLGPEGRYMASKRELRQRFEELDASGASSAQIARALGVTDRTVRNRRLARRSRGRGRDEHARGQGDLFR